MNLGTCFFLHLGPTFLTDQLNADRLLREDGEEVSTRTLNHFFRQFEVQTYVLMEVNLIMYGTNIYKFGFIGIQ